MNKSSSGWWSWKLTQEDLKTQVEKYHTLKITQSHRGISALLVVGSVALSVLMALFEMLPFEFVFAVLIYLPIAFFIYKGHRWAMVLMMVLWTLEKAYQLYQIGEGGTGNAILPIIWWFIFMGELYRAYRVETARRKSTAGIAAA